MLIAHFLLVNAHFVISLLAALVAFAVAWLYFDAWLGRKTFKESFVYLGFFFLSVSFVVQAIYIEQALLERSILGPDTILLAKSFLRIAAYLFLIIGQLAVPLQPLPEYRKAEVKEAGLLIIPFLGINLVQSSFFLFPILAATTGLLYLRRATKGMEHHLKPISLSFFILSFYELFGLAVLFRSSDNLFVSKLVAPFGPLWIAERIILIIAVYFLGKWAWSYLLKRFESQLFIIFTTSTLVIFLITAVSFTFATLNNLKADTLDSLKTDVGVLGYTIESKKAEVLSDAQLIAQNPQVVEALASADRKALADLTVPILLAKKQASLVVLSDTGSIVLRAEDVEKYGGSLSEDPLVKRALAGKDVSSVASKDGIPAPVMTVRAATSVKDGETIVGAIMVGVDIDSAYVDGVKDATGLDASIYSDNIRSATTFIAPDGKSRYLGIKEESEQIKKDVLGEGKDFTGTADILNVPYFAAYSPLKDLDANPLGMLFVGKPQVSILQTASKSIELTFLITAILLVLSIAPSYFISKYIVGQIR